MKINLESHIGRKVALLSLAVLTIAGTAVAVITYEFTTWSGLKISSPDTFIARCTKTPSGLQVQGNEIRIGNPHGIWDSDIDIVCALKGRTNLGSARLSSFYRPRQGEEYLVFSKYHAGFYYAIERYRIVPLGMGYPTNELAGKSFDQQIQSLLQYRLDMLKREMEQAQEEKSRLEEGLKQ